MTETIATRVSISWTLHILQSEIIAGLSMWWTARALPLAISCQTAGSCHGSRVARSKARFGRGSLSHRPVSQPQPAGCMLTPPSPERGFVFILDELPAERGFCNSQPPGLVFIPEGL